MSTKLIKWTYVNLMIQFLNEKKNWKDGNQKGFELTNRHDDFQIIFWKFGVVIKEINQGLSQQGDKLNESKMFPYHFFILACNNMKHGKKIIQLNWIVPENVRPFLWWDFKLWEKLRNGFNSTKKWYQMTCFGVVYFIEFNQFFHVSNSLIALSRETRNHH